MSGGPRLAESEPGLVAMEWPTEDIDPDFQTLDAHAALMAVARRHAQRLGARPGMGAATVYTVQREYGEAFRFVWGREDAT